MALCSLVVSFHFVRRHLKDMQLILGLVQIEELAGMDGFKSIQLKKVPFGFSLKLQNTNTPCLNKPTAYNPSREICEQQHHFLKPGFLRVTLCVS